MILQCRAHMYIPWWTFQNRFFLLSRNMFAIRNHVFILPLFSCSLNKLFSLEGYLLPSSEIHEIPCNLHAQFSASIFSGIQNTYVSYSCSPCNMCARPCKLQVYVYVYVQACPGAIERKAEERKDEWARENCRLSGVDDLCSAKWLQSALHDRNNFCQLNNLEVLFVLGLISDNLSIWIPFIILSYILR